MATSSAARNPTVTVGATLNGTNEPTDAVIRCKVEVEVEVEVEVGVEVEVEVEVGVERSRYAAGSGVRSARS
jgi:hypothetical protein